MLTTSLVVIGALFYTLSFFLLQDRVLTMQIRNNFQKSLKKTGLKIEIKNIHWSGWGSFGCSKVLLVDTKQKVVPIQAEQVNVSVDILTLLKNRRHPESALRKIELINPSVKLRRFSDGTLDIQKYFPKSDRKLYLETVFIVKNGDLSLDDDLYGKYSLKQVNGKARFYQDSTFDWDCNGISDFNKDFLWRSRGDAATNLKIGHGEVSTNNLLLSKIAPFLPEPYTFKIYRGTGKFDLKFSWYKKQFWLESGAVTLNNTQFKLPATNELLDIKELDGEISPSKLKIKNARIVYNDALFRVSGELDTKTAAVKGILSGDRIRLVDLPKFIPTLRPYQIEGLTNLRVDVSGNLDQPIINGEISLTGVALDIKKDLRLKDITGQAKIVRNNLEIDKLEGFLDKALVSVDGKICNIFAPTFDLNILGAGLNLTQFNLPEPDGLKISPKIDFVGKVRGELWSPIVSGEFEIDKLKYQDIETKNLRAAISWDSLSNNIQISKLEGEIGGGRFSAKGAVKINTGGVEWKISGEIMQLDLGRTKFGSELGIRGKISSNAILKGKWKQGEPFEPGLILGTFKGDGFANQELYLKDIQGVYSWKEGKLIVDSIQARTGQGRVYGHLAWNTGILTANFNAEHVPIRDLLPDAKKYPFDGVFDGVFEFNGPLSDIDGKIKYSLKQATYLSKQIGEVTGNLEYADQGLNIGTLRVTSDSGDYSIKGRVNWATEPTLRLTVNSDNAKLEGFSKWLPIDPSLRLGGTGILNLELSGSVFNPTYAGLIQLANPSLGNFQMEQGSIQLEGDFREVRLNRMELRDGISAIEVSGKANQDNLDLVLNGNQIRLDPLGFEYNGNKLLGILNFKGKLVGKLSNPVLSVELSPGNLVFGPFSGEIISGSIDWKGKEIQLSRIEFSGEDSKLNMYGKIDFSQPLTVDLGINVTDLGLTKMLQVFKVSGTAVTGGLSGLVKITGNPFQPEIRVNGELSNTTLSSVPVQGEFELNYYNNRLSIEKIKLRQNFGSLVASGVWEPNSALSLQIKATGFSLETFNTFISPAYKLAGTIDVSSNLVLSSTKISGELNANVDELYLNQNRLGDLQLQGKFSEQGFSINESTLNTKGGFITAQGFLPWPDQIFSKMIDFHEPSRGLDLELVFKNTPVELANSYLPQNFSVTSGSMDGKIHLQGAYGWPVFSGKLEASNVGVATSDLPLPIKNARIEMEINDNRISIQQAHGEYGTGKFTLNGKAKFFGEEDQLHFELNFKGSNLYYSNDYFDGFGNLNIQLAGTTNNSKLSGEVHVYDCKIGKLKMNKTRASSVNWNPDFDLRITAGKNVRYRQIGLADVMVRGDLRIGGDFKSPLISGEATSKKGVLTLYGQTFKVNKAKASFKYSQGCNPYLDVDSSVLTSKAEVFLIVKGQIGENLSINLYSYPSLSEGDLYALLNWSELRGDKPLTVQGVANTNLSMVTDTVFGEVFYGLRQALHLDYLYLEHDFLEDEFRLSAGDFVSSRLFLSYSRSVSDQPKEKWGLEYHLTSNLLAGGNYSLEDGTSWRLTYRFRF